MKDSFHQFYDALKKDLQYSPWSQNLTFPDRIKELQKEIEEVSQALEKQDLANLHEELGDVLWDALALIVLAEDKHGFEPKQIIDNTFAKLQRRKPWIFNGEKLAPEEESRRWKEAKRMEKE